MNVKFKRSGFHLFASKTNIYFIAVDDGAHGKCSLFPEKLYELHSEVEEKVISRLSL